MTSGIDVRPGLVNTRVDDEAGSIHLGASRFGRSTLLVDEDEIAGVDRGEVLRIRVCSFCQNRHKCYTCLRSKEGLLIQKQSVRTGSLFFTRI